MRLKKLYEIHVFVIKFYLQTISSAKEGEGKAQGWKRAMGGEALMTEGNICDIF